MTSISSMQMGEVVASHPHIYIKKSWFGLKKDTIYSPTGETVSGYELYINGKRSKIVDHIMEAETKDELQLLLDKGERLQTDANGNERLDLCLSADQKFAALQFFRYEGYVFRVQTEVRFFEGEEAQKVAELLDIAHNN